MQTVNVFGVEIHFGIYLTVFFLVWSVALVFLQRIVFGVVRRVANRTAWKFDDILLDAMNVPLILLIFGAGAYAACRTAGYDKGVALAAPAFKATVIVALVLFLDKLIRDLLRHYSPKVELLKTSGGVVRGFSRGIIYGLGLLILLNSFGVSLTPVLASLGVGSLAVALALQPTLENFFSGIQIIGDRIIMVGQFIRLDSGEEGYVEKIGWRSTWIRLLPNNTVIVPNKVLVNARILNYYYPQKELAVLVNVGVSYDSDLERVERITIDVARDVMKTVPGGVPGFEPFIRYNTFNQSSIDFTVILRGNEFVDQYLIKHEFIKRLHARYRKEGVVIPFPLRTIDIPPATAQVLKTMFEKGGK
ncbi:MAG TPA: mechanosensitive ion channel family protein [Candidatus Omnitrophota bacterium]|nr:mechanosensitive ion channel family protein [Candidatus Omnitrophota bacterium]